MKKLPLFALLLWQTVLYCQPSDLRIHTSFFEEQAELYQDWLEGSGLKSVIQVHELNVQPEGVILNLRFTSPHADSLAQSWYAAKEAFAADNLLTLEEGLFLKVIRLFDLKSDQIFLQIKNSYQAVGEIYYVKIYTMEGEMRVDQNFAKGFFGKVAIDLVLMAQSTNEQELGSGAKTKAEVYDKIRQFIQKQYGKKQNCQNGMPAIDAFRSMNEKLIVSVSGLCREVLDQEEELLFCSILNRLNWDCESVKREALHFEFDFDTDSKKIYCQLDGKYSNDYVLFRGKVRDMDDDPMFEKLLKKHGEDFLKSLKVWLEQQ